jgi:hypothetical protein
LDGELDHRTALGPFGGGDADDVAGKDSPLGPQLGEPDLAAGRPSELVVETRDDVGTRAAP